MFWHGPIDEAARALKGAQTLVDKRRDGLWSIGARQGGRHVFFKAGISCRRINNEARKSFDA